MLTSRRPTAAREILGGEHDASIDRREAPRQMKGDGTTARLMNVAEAAVAEFDRQGVAEALALLGFDAMALVRAVIKAADGDVILFPGPPLLTSTQ
jgi:hypothetical protein